MMFDLLRALGAGKKLVVVSSSITGTGSIDTGLNSIDYAVASVVDSESSIPTHTASITGTSGGTVNVVVTEHQASANTVATSAKTVVVFAVGE